MSRRSEPVGFDHMIGTRAVGRTTRGGAPWAPCALVDPRERPPSGGGGGDGGVVVVVGWWCVCYLGVLWGCGGGCRVVSRVMCVWGVGFVGFCGWWGGLMFGVVGVGGVGEGGVGVGGVCYSGWIVISVGGGV